LQRVFPCSFNETEPSRPEAPGFGEQKRRRMFATRLKPPHCPPNSLARSDPAYPAISGIQLASRCVQPARILAALQKLSRPRQGLMVAFHLICLAFFVPCVRPR
jgi:hypothetical protein